MNSHRTDERARTFKRMILGGVLAAVTLAWMPAFTSAGATALGGPTVIDEGQEACYTEVPFQEYQYTRTTPTTENEYKKEIKTETFKTQYEVDKYVRERTKSDGSWSAWSSPTRWIPTGTRLAWVDAVAAPNWGQHYYTTTYQRDWAIMGTGFTRQTSTGFNTTYEYQWSLTNPGAPWVATGNTRAGTPIVDGPTDWLLAPPAGTGWVQVAERTSYKQGERIPCPPPETPDPTYTQWVDGTYKCDDTTVTQTRTKTVYGWKLAENGYDWVASEPVVTTETRTRALTAAEITVCPTVPRTIDVSAFSPVCISDAPFIKYAIVPNGFTPVGGATLRIFAANGTLVKEEQVPSMSGTLIWPGATVANGVATDWPGWMLAGDGVSWIPDPSDAYLREGLTIEVTVNPTATAKVSYPPATDVCAGPKVVPPTTVVVEAQGPTPPPAPEVPAGGLPATGGSSWAPALIGLMALLGGTGLVRLSRRPTN